MYRYIGLGVGDEGPSCGFGTEIKCSAIKCLQSFVEPLST